MRLMPLLAALALLGACERAPLTVPEGEVTQLVAWDAVVGMRVGGRRTLFIPPHMAYGDRGVGDVITAHATLVFEVELLEVRR